MIPEAHVLQVANCGEKRRNELHSPSLEQSPQGTDNLQAMILCKVAAQPFINQNPIGPCDQGGGDRVALPGVEHEKPGIRNGRRRLDLNPRKGVQRRHRDRPTGLAFPNDFLYEAEDTMNLMEQFKLTESRERKQRGGVGKDRHGSEDSRWKSASP